MRGFLLWECKPLNPCLLSPDLMIFCMPSTMVLESTGLIRNDEGWAGMAAYCHCPAIEKTSSIFPLGRSFPAGKRLGFVSLHSPEPWTS
jgi:hypothetical protein